MNGWAYGPPAQGGGGGKDNICPLGHILTSVLILASPDLAAWSCASAFGNTVPNSPIQAAAH